MPEHPPGMSPSDGSKEKEIKKRNPPTPQGGFSPEFKVFWKAWPNKKRATDEAGTFRKWKAALKRGATPDQIMASLAAWMLDPDWKRDGGFYIPGPEPWLNQKKYLAKFDTGPGPDSPEVRAAVQKYRNEVKGGQPAGHVRSRIRDSVPANVYAVFVKVIDG